MNMNFTEVNNLDNEDYFDVNEYESNNNYWETPKTEVTKNKKISYNDILNSLNLVVNKNGVLQYMSVNPNGGNEQQPQYQQPQYQQPQTKGKPLEPQVKNSYIFNKYFKDYNDPNSEIIQEVKTPQTIEEYNQMVLEERIRRIQERNRIAQIKSTKMLYESNNGNMANGNISNAPIRASKNNLRMMKFG